MNTRARANTQALGDLLDPTTILETIRNGRTTTETRGLDDDRVRAFALNDRSLQLALRRAGERHRTLHARDPGLLEVDEPELCERLQDGVLNFYPDTARSPYVPLAAAGPWVVTLHGAVLYDAGGYGMLGLGHAPPALLEIMGTPWVMANVMTPSLAQARLIERLQREIGHTRGGCPYRQFAFLNSGSEAVSLAMRLVDVNAERLTDPDTRLRVVSLQDGFHGRTYRPARASHSTRGAYRENLASFREADDLVPVRANDLDGLRRAFEQAERDGAFIEAVLIEPVLGEGPAGLAIGREFYDLARALATRHGALLVVDSVQAGLRAHGCLSIVDYPGFQDCVPPDVETWSKALNAGQFPLSVIGLSESATSLYVPGIYGNTMTGNPRAMEVGCAVLDSVTPPLRENVRARGRELIEGLEGLSRAFPGAIRRITGTGLMASAEMDPDRYPVNGVDGLERAVRTHGVIAIHAGHNGMRYTPHLWLTSEEVALMIDVLREAMADRAARIPPEPPSKQPGALEPGASEGA